MRSLEARARRAYELGRFYAGIRATWPVALLVAIASWCGGARPRC